MRLHYNGRLRQAAQNLRNGFTSSKALILVYHRIAEMTSDPQLLCVSPKHFAEHLEVLQENYRPMRLRHLAQSFQVEDLPHRTVVVTFDDGYGDNLYTGKPLLENYEVPATMFVTTGYIGEQREFYWDELDRLLLQPGVLPEKLCLNIKEQMFRWELGSEARYTQEAYRLHCGWNVMEEEDPGPRQRLYRALCALVHPLPDEERRRILDELRAWADTDVIGRPTHRALSHDEVLQLDAGDLIEVGAHTVSHPALSKLPADAQRDEIERSKQQLDDIVGHPVTSFSYPYGSRSDYTAETANIVRETGFAYACSNFADVVWRGSNRFQLPRVLVRNWDGDEFVARLKGWLHG